jgi:hypothetical protein
VFFESYFEDTFPTTNLESLACGTLWLHIKQEEA